MTAPVTALPRRRADAELNACQAVLPGRAVRFCEACQRDLAGSELTESTFAATHVPAGRHSSPGGAKRVCTVARDGVRCARPHVSRGLCMSHHSSWRVYWRRTEPGGQPMTAQQWARMVATPYPDPPPDCLVSACPGTAASRHGLCDYHVRLWWNARKTGPPVTAAQWAAAQIAYLAGYQFSLRPLPELLRWELLFALQHRDTSRPRLHPSEVRGAVTELAKLNLETLLGDPLGPPPARWPGNKTVAGELSYLAWATGLGFDEFRGIKATDKTVLDLRAVSLAPAHPNGRRRRAEPPRVQWRLGSAGSVCCAAVL